MNRLHVLVLLAAMACTGLVMGTVKAEAADSGKELRAAVNATAPPFAFMENGKLVGFEVDLHAEVAKRMGKQLVMTNIPFAGLAPGLQAKSGMPREYVDQQGTPCHDGLFRSVG